MKANGYYITNENSEDRLDITDNLADAIRIARELVNTYFRGTGIASDLPGGLIEARVLRTHQWIERDGTRLEPLTADTRPRALEARVSALEAEVADLKAQLADLLE